MGQKRSPNCTHSETRWGPGRRVTPAACTKDGNEHVAGKSKSKFLDQRTKPFRSWLICSCSVLSSSQQDLNVTLDLPWARLRHRFDKNRINCIRPVSSFSCHHFTSVTSSLLRSPLHDTLIWRKFVCNHILDIEFFKGFCYLANTFLDLFKYYVHSH